MALEWHRACDVFWKCLNSYEACTMYNVQCIKYIGNSMKHEIVVVILLEHRSLQCTPIHIEHITGFKSIFRSCWAFCNRNRGKSDTQSKLNFSSTGPCMLVDIDACLFRAWNSFLIFNYIDTAVATVAAVLWRFRWGKIHSFTHNMCCIGRCVCVCMCAYMHSTK